MAIKLKKKNTKVKKVIKKVRKSSSSAVKADKKTANGKTLKFPKGKYTEGIGRRKVATARVRIYESSGDFIVNDQLVSDYFSNVRNAPKIYNRPFIVTDTLGKYSVTVKVSGSGIKAQIGAVIHGLSRALIKATPEIKPLLKAEGLLTRDDRMKESRKMGRGGKARRKRQSPKR